MNDRGLKRQTSPKASKFPSNSDSNIVSINTYFFSNSKIVKIKRSYTTVHAMTILLQVVIGGINVDFIAKGKTKALKVSFIYDMESATIVQRRWTRLTSENSRYLFQFGQTNPGSVCQSFGGVGRNIAGWLFFLNLIMFYIMNIVSWVSWVISLNVSLKTL